MAIECYKLWLRHQFARHHYPLNATFRYSKTFFEFIFSKRFVWRNGETFAEAVWRFDLRLQTPFAFAFEIYVGNGQMAMLKVRHHSSPSPVAFVVAIF